MKKTVLLVFLLLLSIFLAGNVLAADRVVVIPLGGQKASGDAVAADVLAGKTFSNKDEVNVSGTMPTQTLSDTTTTVSAGYYAGTDLATVDTDLVSQNICLGVIIFGVTGTKACTNEIYGTVISAGQVWMDRNLGASQVATSSTDTLAYGDLYQWGRGSDGHQSRTSLTTSTNSTTDVPGHGSFILALNTPYDWLDPQNDALWQDVAGTNNPCPAGFRLPTELEWGTERGSWLTGNNAAGAFASPLKLVFAGYRNYSNGSLYVAGSGGYYWSSTVFGVDSRSLYFYSSDAYTYDVNRAYGFSVRCLKD